MATENSFDSQPATFQNSEFFNGFIVILTATGIKAAKPFGNDIRQPAIIGGKRFLINPYQE